MSSEHNHSDRQSEMESEHDYEFVGTYKGREGTSGKVYTDDGKRAWLPRIGIDLDEEAYRYGARIAFDTDKEFAEDISFAPLPNIVRARFLGRNHEYDDVGEVVYEHDGRFFVSIDSRAKDVEIYRKRIWGGEDVEVGDKIAFDWMKDDMVRRAEVRKSSQDRGQSVDQAEHDDDSSGAFSGPTVEFPTNWQARKVLGFVREQKENADTKAAVTHWSQLESEITNSVESSTNNEDTSHNE